MTPEDKDPDDMDTTTETPLLGAPAAPAAQPTPPAQPAPAVSAAQPAPAGPDSHIAELRRRIDEIDAAIIALWLERAAISKEVGATRVAAGGTRLVLAREQEILNRFRTALGADGTDLAMLILRAGRGPLL
jgi:chorismate mutase